MWHTGQYAHAVGDALNACRRLPAHPASRCQAHGVHECEDLTFARADTHANCTDCTYVAVQTRCGVASGCAHWELIQGHPKSMAHGCPYLRQQHHLALPVIGILLACRTRQQQQQQQQIQQCEVSKSACVVAAQLQQVLPSAGMSGLQLNNKTRVCTSQTVQPPRYTWTKRQRTRLCCCAYL